jgi:hypothetical protein
LKKLGYLFYLPGGQTKYVSSLMKFLELVRARNPTRKNFIDVFSKEVKVADGYLKLLNKLHLVEEKDGKIEVTTSGMKILESNDFNPIFQVLQDNFPEFAEIIKTLYKTPLPLEDIIESFQKLGITGNKTQWNLRLNWLLSLGYVSKNGVYKLTQEGRKTAKCMVKEVNEPLHDKTLHSKLKEELVAAGKNLKLISRPEFPMDDESLDVIWMQRGAEIPFVVFEISIEGELDKAIRKIATARKKWNADPILFTTEDQIHDAKSIISTGYSVMDPEQVVKSWKEIHFLTDFAKKFPMFNRLFSREATLEFRRVRQIRQ